MKAYIQKLNNMCTSSPLGILPLLIVTFRCVGAQTTGTCESPQFLELRERGIINCVFHQEFYSVLWYNTTEYLNNVPVLDYQNTIKTGVGYESGDFDVYPNGSLIINRVSLQHDSFTVAYLHTTKDVPTFIHIQVVVVDKPEVAFPVINLCGNSSKHCYSEIESSPVTCSVSKVRPEVIVSLCARTVYGDQNISTELFITRDGGGYTSTVTSMDVFHYSSLLILLVCKASSPPGTLKHNESMVLVQNGGMRSLSDKSTVKYFERNTTLKLDCTDKDIGFVVWRKMTTNSISKSKVVLYSLFIGEIVTEIFAEDVSTDGRGYLVILKIQVNHEGRYVCIYGNGLSDGASLYDVIIIVPAYPVIEGCNQEQYCVRKVEYEGTLTCKVTGIRPRVQLRWKTFSDDDTPLIDFTKQQLVVTESGDTFDVVLVSEFRVTETSHDKVTVECKVVASQEQLLGLAVKMDLLLAKGDVLPKNPKSKGQPWIIAIVVVCLLIVLAIIIKVIRTRNNSTKKDGNLEETTSMFEKSHPTDTGYEVEMKQKFLKEVREKYRDLYDAVQPIPYIKDRLYCVDKVFVEGGIEYLAARTGETKGHWVSLASYENVFDNTHVKSPRRILEGEPGYGKSTVTLQFAYDWCNSIPASPLRDVEILVLLRLRQLEGVESIYRAIRQFILPRDSRLSESNIEHILLDSNSVVIILDGFDEYPDQDSTTSDVSSIIGREMFQDFEVVLTTRSSFLPKKYPPLTKRLRLTGFDENARRYYIRKAVVGGNKENSVSKIEGYLEENPILSDLCQVPLLFVIFAHMTYESENFRKLNSVTSFFRYMISCFHSHMRNKMDDKNVRKYKLFETGHQNLDKLAFEALSGESQRIVWNKDEMCQLVGQEFYDQYIRIGILVEEDSVDIIYDPRAPTTGHVQYKKEVRFYHKLFCEWYAAHYLANYIEQNPNLDLSEFLQRLDPFDVQYLYRFSCGLNTYSSTKIIEYLKNTEDGDKFAILCILEQTGKFDNIEETIRQLCLEGIIISGHDSLLLQRSSLQVLEIAAKNGISTSYLSLHNCFQSVDLSTIAIRTTSGLCLTSKIPVERLAIRQYKSELTEDEYIAILEFSSMCPSLRFLGLSGSVPPRCLNVGTALSTLYSREVVVKYRGQTLQSPRYILNLLTGRWERVDDGSECTEEDFERMKSERSKVKDITEEDFKRFLQLGRKNLRKRFEEGQTEVTDYDNKDDG